MKLGSRVGSAIVIGIIASVVLHAAAFICFSTEYFQSYHPGHQWFPTLFFTPGTVFTGGDSGARFLVCNLLAFALVFAAASFYLSIGHSRTMVRLTAAILIGVVLSAALHFLVLEYVWKFRAYDGSVSTAFFSLGSLLAPRGFESQAVLTLPLNVLAVALLFATGAFLLLVRRERRRH